MVFELTFFHVRRLNTLLMELFKNSSFSILRFIHSQTSQQSDGSCNVSRDTQPLHDFFSKNSLFFLQTPIKSKLWVKSSLLFNKRQGVLLTQLYVTPSSERRHWRLVAKTGCFLLWLPRRGLTIYNSQVSIQWQNCGQEWTSVWCLVESSLF